MIDYSELRKESGRFVRMVRDEWNRYERADFHRRCEEARMDSRRLVERIRGDRYD